MPPAERFDILVLGSGKGGKLLAWSLARSGMSPFMGRLLLMRWPVHEGMTRGPGIKPEEGVNRCPIWLPLSRSLHTALAALREH